MKKTRRFLAVLLSVNILFGCLQADIAAAEETAVLAPEKSTVEETYELVSVSELMPLIIPNGTQLVEIKRMLPTSIKVEIKNAAGEIEKEYLEVEWGAGNSDTYRDIIYAEQEFYFDGTLILREDIKNPDNIPLDIRQDVTVKAKSDETTMKKYEIEGAEQIVTVLLKYDNAIFYTGKKITAGNLNAELNLESFYSDLGFTRTGLSPEAVFTVKYLYPQKAKDVKNATDTKAYFYASLVFKENWRKRVKEDGLDDAYIEKCVNALNDAMSENRCYFTIRKVSLEGGDISNLRYEKVQGTGRIVRVWDVEVTLKVDGVQRQYKLNKKDYEFSYKKIKEDVYTLYLKGKEKNFTGILEKKKVRMP